MTVQRLPRGTRVDSISLGLLVERANKERFALIARNSGMTSSALFDALVEHMPLDEQGRPDWLPTALKTKDAELPIKSA